MKDLELADTGSSDDIELIIGSYFYWAFVTGNVRLGKVGEPQGVESKFWWLLNFPAPKQQSVSTNLSFANENSSHVLFCNAQNSVDNHLDKELHHSDKELHLLDKELHRLDKELHRFWGS